MEELKNKYNTVIILKSNIAENELAKIKDKLKEICIEIENLEDIGIREFNYEIRGNKEGFYLICTWYGNSEKTNILHDFLRNEHKVLKFITVKLNEEEN